MTIPFSPLLTKRWRLFQVLNDALREGEDAVGEVLPAEVGLAADEEDEVCRLVGQEDVGRELKVGDEPVLTDEELPDDDEEEADPPPDDSFAVAEPEDDEEAVR